MAEQRDYRALEWVGDEMDQALGQAQIALQGWCLQPAVVAPLQRYRAQLHQVAGGLRMVEFTAQALLAEAMEHVSRAMLKQRIPGQMQAGDGQALSTGTEIRYERTGSMVMCNR